MVIYKKNIFDVMLHLDAKGPSKQYILMADTILAEPGPWPGLRFGGQDTFLWGNDFCFYHMFKTKFLSTTKFSGIKNFG